MTRCCGILVVVLTTSWAPGQACMNQDFTDPERVLESVEGKLSEATTVQVRFECAVVGAEMYDFEAKGSLILQQGDKMRIEYTHDAAFFKGRPEKIVYISNGKSVVDSREPNEVQPTPEGLFLFIALYMVRRGGLYPGFGEAVSHVGKLDPPEGKYKGVIVKDKEDVNGKSAYPLEYTVLANESSGESVVTMWVDAETLVPVKMVVKQPESKAVYTEIYESITLNEEVEEKTFELPAKANH